MRGHGEHECHHICQVMKTGHMHSIHKMIFTVLHGIDILCIALYYMQMTQRFLYHSNKDRMQEIPVDKLGRLDLVI